MAATFDKSKQDFRFAGAANDGWSKEDEATATCFCGTVQLVFVGSALRIPSLSLENFYGLSFCFVHTLQSIPTPL